MEKANWDTLEEVQSRPGIFRHIFTAGRLQVVHYRYEPGSVFEAHTHPEEQLTVGLAGVLEFDVAGEKHLLGPGDLVHLPGGVPHGARNVGPEACITLNFSSPPKEY